MKKLVIKTAVITFGGIVAFVSVLYGVIAAFFPLVLGDAFFTLGENSVAVTYYEINYEKTKDIADLADMCVMVEEVSDAGRAKRLLTALVESQGYAEYCATADKNYGNALTTNEFFIGKLATSVMVSDGVEGFLIFCKERVTVYNDYNPYYITLTHEEDLFAVQDLISVKERLNELKTSLSENRYLVRDIEIVNQLIDKKQA